MVTAQGLNKLGFASMVDFILQDDGDGVYIKEWNSNEEQPTEDVITAAHNEYQAEYEAQEYARNRKAKYDALNQLELISDDSINGTTTHKDAILAIKAEFPKPE